MDRLLQIARKEVLDAARERELYVAGVLFVLIGVGLGYFVGNATDPPANAVAVGTLGGLVFVGSLVSIALSYNRIVGKRASGELRVLLSLPYSRFEITYGTILGRWALLVSMTTTTVIVAAVLATVMGATVAAVPLVVTGLAAAATVAMFVSLSVGLSAGTANTTRAAGGAFGLFILFLFNLWGAAPTGVRYVLNGFERPGSPAPTWAKAWGQISPLAGLRNAIAESYPDLANVLSGWAPSVSTPTPVYAEPWFGAVVVLVWIVLPVTAGYLRLRDADL